MQEEGKTRKRDARERSENMKERIIGWRWT
jgi:hypothetical protein